MAKYQVWGFTYLADSKGVNVLTGNNEEVDGEFNIPCFNGIAFFKVNNKCYIARYPKIQSLTKDDKETIEKYCGYIPESGEYGVICGALGKITECSHSLYEACCNTYPVTKKDKAILGYQG